ncbi:unnamed protein product, partial [Soboliphyme baturini]|uniref:LEDGF domain-containing protein n=1 Tax=Soboliphyme baturini TaxID=241478 RepID=A0A183IYK2_9BILA
MDHRSQLRKIAKQIPPCWPKPSSNADTIDSFLVIQLADKVKALFLEVSKVLDDLLQFIEDQKIVMLRRTYSGIMDVRASTIRNNEQSASEAESIVSVEDDGYPAAQNSPDLQEREHENICFQKTVQKEESSVVEEDFSNNNNSSENNARPKERRRVTGAMCTAADDKGPICETDVGCPDRNSLHPSAKTENPPAMLKLAERASEMKTDNEASTSHINLSTESPDQVTPVEAPRPVTLPQPSQNTEDVKQRTESAHHVDANFQQQLKSGGVDDGPVHGVNQESAQEERHAQTECPI